MNNPNALVEGLSTLLPPGAVLVIDIDDGLTVPPLWPEEAAALGPCVDSRRREFARGRACARRAVTALGFRPEPILRKGRAPVWPSTVVGSITHCSGFVAAAVLPKSVNCEIGIDVEMRGRVPDHLAERLAHPHELTHRPVGIQAEDWLTFLWCAKEAVYKCLHSNCGAFIDFLDIELSFNNARYFQIKRVNRSSVAPLAKSLRGQIVAIEHHIFAVACRPAGEPESTGFGPFTWSD